jgi:SulP family sulfate permease
MLLGLLIGKPIDAAAFNWSVHFPRLIPYGWPSLDDFLWVIPVLVLPQIPMTIGNAIISNTDIMHEYFGDRARRATYRSVANSQGLADIISFFLGGIPMCHGAGGMAAHYRFGARTAGSNLIIGGIFVLLALVFGENIVAILKLLPFSLLGVLLVFAGLQLALMIQDLQDRKDLFVALFMLGIALASNLGVAFIVGIIVAYAFKSEKLAV